MAISDAESLQTLKALATWMREVGAVKASTGLIELELGPPPVIPTTTAPDFLELPEVREERENAEYLNILLHSSGASVSPFLAKRKS